METVAKNSTKYLLQTPLDELIALANKIRQDNLPDVFEKCSIINARSGRCSEDCKFCAQSARRKTSIDIYQLKTVDQIVEAAQDAKAIGAQKFGIVTSGNRLSDSELDTVTKAVTKIKQNIDIDICASLGTLTAQQLQTLKNVHLSRYHHNIESSRNYYAKIVTTHTFDERVNTIKAAKEVGLQVCSGGIIGMGESWHDRIDMAETLRELSVDSVPINILIPVKGTPLENIEPISVDDAIRTICIFRIILKDKIIKVAAGRETHLKDEQVKAFLAGANGMLIGGYLTIKGNPLQADYELIEKIKEQWKK